MTLLVVLIITATVIYSLEHRLHNLTAYFGYFDLPRSAHPSTLSASQWDGKINIRFSAE